MMAHRFPRSAEALIRTLGLVLALALAPPLAGTAAAAPPPDEDPLPGILRRIERYLRKN